MKVTVNELLVLHACKKQIAIFDNEWPDGAEITEKNYLRACELNLDLDWVANNFLVAVAQAEYDRVRRLALAEYERVRRPALAEYGRACASALAGQIIDQEQIMNSGGVAIDGNQVKE